MRVIDQLPRFKTLSALARSRDDVILAVHHNCREITPDQVRKQVYEILANRLEDLNYLLDNNIEEIMQEARKGREV